MLLKTEGIVLKNVQFGESSLIVDIYSLAQGRLSCVINGVRSAKANTKQSTLAIGSLVEAVIYHRPQKELQRFKEVKPLYVYRSIPFNVIKGTVALFVTELIEKTVKESENNDALYTFLKQSYVFLDECHQVANFPLVFAIKLLPYLGFSAGNNWSKQLPYFDMRESIFVEKPPHMMFLESNLSILFQEIINKPFQEMETLIINKEERRELLDSIIQYYEYHLESFNKMNSHLILRTVLED